MRLHWRIYLFVLTGSIVLFSNQKTQDDWGFYGHRLINKMAVFTLPPPLNQFYKNEIDYIAEHAVDPDKRRYAIKAEAVRHYIDLDHWGDSAWITLPRSLGKAIGIYSSFYLCHELDTISVFEPIKLADQNKLKFVTFSQEFLSRVICLRGELSLDSLGNWIQWYAMREYDQTHWIVEDQEVLRHLIPELNSEHHLWIKDEFTAHGILPYHLKSMYDRLIQAWKMHDANLVLKLSADIGHYIGDAHVPLHTSENYNGQLSNQIGIHAFWESRIPELFAEEDFDFWTGTAEFVAHPVSYFWNIIRTSHHYVDSTLAIEKQISQEIPSDLQYCYEERLGLITKLPCKEYSALYHQRLNRQVEARMKASIRAIGSIWYSAWVEAGQPDILQLQRDLPIELNSDSIPLAKRSELNLREHE
ncbi:MAG TPA: zinc dependent phospholipase C family protein [Saprospiraceae bacterium]|nr:zinc dependent phospholipase C family protein [Saprospiraceae bacterium]